MLISKTGLDYLAGGAGVDPRVGRTRPALALGLLIVAEIQLRTRRVLEFLLSPVRNAFDEAARER